MNDNVNVEKWSVKDFFSKSQEEPILIPEYQRQYSWDEEQVSQLLEDISNYVDDNYTNIQSSIQKVEPYFMGSIMYYLNESKKEIIDGQQRITTIMLLLRSIYKKLENDDSPESLGLKTDIEELLWKRNIMTKKLM